MGAYLERKIVSIRFSVFRYQFVITGIIAVDLVAEQVVHATPETGAVFAKYILESLIFAFARLELFFQF